MFMDTECDLMNEMSRLEKDVAKNKVSKGDAKCFTCGKPWHQAEDCR